MVAITSCAGHIPPFRIATDAIRERWGGGSKGIKTKAVAAPDDDSVTLGLSAARDALAGRADIGSLFFASTTQPYEHGEITPLLVEKLGLPPETYTVTVSHSSRAGSAGLRSALSQVQASGVPALVIASEVPCPEPDTDFEKTAGAGAGAVLIEPVDDTGLVSLSTGTYSKPMLEEWQAPGGTRRHGDDRFGRDVGYVDTTVAASRQALSAAGWDANELDGLVVSQPSPKFPSRIARSLGCSSDIILSSDLATNHGDLGSASPLVALAGADPTTGERLLVAGYGAGTADAMTIEVASEPATSFPKIESTTELSYLDYLEYTDNL